MLRSCFRDVLWLFVLAGLTGAGCSAPAEPEHSSGVRGDCTLTLIPGVQPPPDMKVQEPAPQPLPGVILRVRASAGGAVLAEAKSDAVGKFQIALKPGTYQVEADPGSAGAMPGGDLEAKQVEVRRGEFAEVQFHFHVALP